MIQISYKDSANWTLVNGLVQNWSVYRDMFKGQRVRTNYLAPEVTTDTWNGKTFDVQHVRWDAWFFEMWVKESELQEVSRLQSCKNILIKDLDNNLSHTLDMQTTEFLQFNEPEQVADTSNYYVSFVYRINKTIIPKAAAILNTNTLITTFTDGVTPVQETFYTDFAIIPIQQDSELSQFSNESGINTTSKAISRNESQIVFYLTSTEANTLKKEFERAQTITLNSVSVLDNRLVEYTAIGEGLVKCVVSCLLEAEISYPLNV